MGLEEKIKIRKYHWLCQYIGCWYIWNSRKKGSIGGTYGHNVPFGKPTRFVWKHQTSCYTLSLWKLISVLSWALRPPQSNLSLQPRSLQPGRLGVRLFTANWVCKYVTLSCIFCIMFKIAGSLLPIVFECCTRAGSWMGGSLMVHLLYLVVLPTFQLVLLSNIFFVCYSLEEWLIGRCMMIIPLSLCPRPILTHPSI